MAGGPVNACATNDCSGTDNPNMQLTVTGASGTVNWLGETWNLPSQSGETRCVCPLTYIQNNQTTGGSQYAYHRWEAFTGTSSHRLNLRRRVYTPFNYAINNVQWGTSFNTLTYSDFNTWSQAPPAGKAASTNNLGLISGVSRPTLNDYLITNDFFGSLVKSGITYTWAKGINWPT